jgi:hypothetical protein
MKLFAVSYKVISQCPLTPLQATENAIAGIHFIVEIKPSGASGFLVLFNNNIFYLWQ